MALYLGILLVTVFISGGKCGCSPDLQNLRTFTTDGYGGFFTGTPEDLQEEIQKRVNDAGWNSVNINLRDAANPEFSIYLSHLTDETLKDCDYDPYEFHEVPVTLLVKVGPAEDATDGDLQLGHFTNTEDTLNPYLVNYQRTNVVDELKINEGDNSVIWSLKHGSDELEIEVEWEDGPQDSRYDLRKRSKGGAYTVKTDFPSTLDWGCDKIENEIQDHPQFCQVLSDNSNEIEKAGMHLSNVNTAEYGDDEGDERNYVMRINKITGYFNELLPFAQEHQTSVFAFYGRGEETVGIAYDCITE